MNKKSKATRLNKYFESVFSKATSTICYPHVRFLMEHVMSFIEITYNGIRTTVLQDLVVKKSFRPDNIHLLILKKYSLELANYVCFTTNHYEIKASNRLKIANVVPIHKSGSKKCVENYQPIYLTCTCCKLMEHVIYSNLIAHFNMDNFLIRAQHGFRSGVSCGNVLVDVCTFWRAARIL